MSGRADQHNARSQVPSIGLLNRPWRQGRRVGRNIYAQLGDAAANRDVIIGQMDSEWLAADIVARHNAALTDRDGGEPC